MASDRASNRLRSTVKIYLIEGTKETISRHMNVTLEGRAIHLGEVAMALLLSNKFRFYDRCT